MDIVNPNIVDYLLSVTPERDGVLQEMEDYALGRNFPIVGALVGRILYLLARSIEAKRILELGSGFGYSAYWFAKATGKEAEIICTDSSQDNADRAKEYMHRAKIANKINFIVGDALKTIDEVQGQFDIIFCDIEKHNYPKAFRKALPRLKKNGLLIADNVLLRGKIMQSEPPDKETAGILTYNRLIYSSKELFSTILPIRDGVSVSVKL